MITYEDYAYLRDSKGLKDSDVARMAGIPPATFSEWKHGRYVPKHKKMVKILSVLDQETPFSNFIARDYDYEELMRLALERPAPAAPVPAAPSLDKFDQELLDLYHNATPAAQESVMTLLRNSQKKSSKLSKEA